MRLSVCATKTLGEKETAKQGTVSVQQGTDGKLACVALSDFMMCGCSLSQRWKGKDHICSLKFSSSAFFFFFKNFSSCCEVLVIVSSLLSSCQKTCQLENSPSSKAAFDSQQKTFSQMKADVRTIAQLQRFKANLLEE